ncbi:EAL and HDOD domain-containing protein [Salinicola rhizosphaerae]|uniref:Histidine kinase n=1 Tax=Salinicola rhizosphaerae TaxID=1443141 RepID=A0ABQ3EHE5_9GAMM|nr:HDOD domain-containing protein [Salinicola rhizosphaerae]GHB34751.1 histidine kinase [Salinicola rhizosphaerae]
MPDADNSHDQKVLFARQPIFDASREIVAFELLFRPTDGGAMPFPFDGNRATSTVLLNAFTQGDLQAVSQGKPVYINFTAETLFNDLPFDPTQLVVEILEDTPYSESIRERLISLRKRGFTLALDDYTDVGAENPYLPFVDLVKIEYPHYCDASFGHVVRELRRHYPHLTLLAEKLENEADLKCCLAAGFDLFQGFFLARPQLMHGAAITTDRMAILKLIATLNQPDVSTRDISGAIERDPTLGVRLLRLVNTAQYQRQTEITSIQQAVTLIGTQRIRSLATLLALSEMEDKPESLQQLAMARACLCRELAANDAALGEKAFIAGLFSYLEAFFNRPLSTLIDSLPLHPSITAALLDRSGPVGALLETAVRFENGEWNEIPWERLKALGISGLDVSDANQRALKAAGDLGANGAL